MSWTAWAERECEAIRAAGRWRELRDLDMAADTSVGLCGGLGPVGTLSVAGRAVVSFASNDYFGLSRHPAVVAAAHAALDRWGTGAGAARLVVGSRPVHSELEAALAEWKGTERALLFPTGFAANLGVLSTLGSPGVRICSDERNHASIIDGCRLARAAGAEVAVYRHGDLDHLEALLADADRVAGGAAGRVAERTVIVTETVFSMDGDEVAVGALTELAARFRALLVLDEAHAVLGPHPDLDGVEVLRVGTLSKVLGALGGFVAGPRRLVELVINRARAFIFTTALTPADSAAGLAALGVVRSSEGDRLRERLAALVERLAPGHPSPIVPVIVGGERAALAASDALLERGLLVPAIRPPTVAPGTSRLRVTLSAVHTDYQLSRLIDAFEELGLELGIEVPVAS